MPKSRRKDNSTGTSTNNVSTDDSLPLKPSKELNSLYKMADRVYGQSNEVESTSISLNVNHLKRMKEEVFKNKMGDGHNLKHSFKSVSKIVNKALDEYYKD